MPLYEVAAVQQPTVDGKNNGDGETIVLAPTVVVADDNNGAIVAATAGKTIPTSRVKFFVRLFQ